MKNGEITRDAMRFYEREGTEERIIAANMYRA